MAVGYADTKYVVCIEDHLFVYNGTAWVPWNGSGAGSGGTASNFGAPFPLAGTAAGAYQASSGDMEPLNLDVDGNLLVAGSLSIAPTKSSTATLSTVAADSANHTALASNTSRQGLRFLNLTTATFYLKYGVTASATSLTDMILPGQSWPQNGWDGYDGQIDVISAATDGVSGHALHVTELTA